jgi:hypothetical protein
MTSFWRSWLKAWCWATLAFGVNLAAAAIPSLDGPTRWFYDLVHWPLDGQSSFNENVRFTCGVLGAVMIGWALTIFAAADAANKLGAPVWRALTGAIVIWYVVDSAISIATGAPGNAASNTVILLSFLAPILASGALGGRVTAAN